MYKFYLQETTKKILRSEVFTAIFLRSMLWLLVTANFVPSLPIPVTVMMEAIRSSKTRRYIPEDGILHRKKNTFCHCILKLTAVILHDDYYSHFLSSSPLLSLNRHNNRLIPLITQFFLIPNRINEFVDQ
jgi:hypothetical protein